MRSVPAGRVGDNKRERSKDRRKIQKRREEERRARAARNSRKEVKKAE